MKQFSVFCAIAVALAFTTSAQAKVSYFNSEQALMRVMHAPEFQKLKAGDATLKHLHFTDVSVNTDGDGGIGTKFTLAFIYGGTLTNEVCKFSATVEVEKAKAPAGITASTLGEASYSKVDCVH